MERVSSKADEIDLLTFGLALWARRNALIACTLSFFILGVLVANTQTTIYQAKVAVYPLRKLNLKVSTGGTRAYVVTSYDLGISTAESSNLTTDRSMFEADLHDIPEVTSESLATKFWGYFQREVIELGATAAL